MRWLDPLFRQVRASTLALARRSGYSLTMVVILALGIGAVTATYALVRGVLLDPLPFPDPDRLVMVRQQNAGGTWNTSVVDLQAIAASSHSFESVAAMRTADALVGAGGDGRWVAARWVTADWFRVLGMDPARGRSYAPGEDSPGAARVVVVGHGFARERFGAADPVGQSLLVDGIAHTVVGVMPAGFERLPATSADLWPLMQLEPPQRRGPFLLGTIARLRPDASLDTARAELAAISRRIFPLWQQGFQDQTARLVPFPLHAMVVGNAGDFLWIAFGAVLVVLLVALVNAANLMLMRVAERGRDLAVRAALGAGRARLARLLVAENLVLAVLGGLAGLALAALLLAAYRAFGPSLPRLAEVGLDLRVAGLVAALMALCGVALAVVPLVGGALGQSTPLLGDSRGASAGQGRTRVRNALVGLQFALALPLLIGTGLLAHSLWRLQQVDPGFDPANLLVASVRLPAEGYPDPPARAAFWDRALPALQQLPGVRGAALLGALPPSCGCFNNFEIIGRPAPQGEQPVVSWVPASEGAFAVLGVRLAEGRLFDSRDAAGTDPVLVVSSTFAERHFPGESAVGKQVFEGGGDTPVTIVGVVSNVKFDGLEQPGSVVFAPSRQGWGGDRMQLVLRTAGDPLALAGAMRRTLQQLDPAVVPGEVGSMAASLRDALGNQRHWAAVIAAFALAATLLAAVGVFAVVAFQVTQRQHEFGICRALGADRRRIAGMVLRRGLRTVGAGIVAGMLLAIALARSLESLLFGVDAADATSWCAAVMLLLLVGAAASVFPARRASRVDPAVVLRHD